MDMQLSDKLALVTGSTAGIGYAIALGLAQEGASVIITGLTDDKVQSAVQSIHEKTGATVYGYTGNIGEYSNAQILLKKHSKIDILVNSLGVYESKLFEDLEDADWLRMFEINVMSGVRLSRLCLPAMKSAKWGRIIFISSEAAIQVPHDMTHYGMSKAGQIAVARGLAESLGGTGITVNSVVPGPTRSRGMEDFLSELAAKEGKAQADIEQDFFVKTRPNSLLGRFIRTEEVADMVVFLASPRSAATTGAVLRVEGGLLKGAF